jgi:3-oxoacyl-[acyl-carrier protein] reductase
VKLEGKVAVVTGASQGLGAAIAERFVAEGAHVVATGRDPDALGATVAKLRTARQRSNQQVLGEAGDVSHPPDVDRLIAFVEDTFGRLDVLVCNAGVYGPLGPIESVEWSEWVRALEINLFGMVLCCRAAVPVMRRQSHGKIIALSGGGATSPLPRISAYAASKAAVVRFAETLAEEVKDAHIDVNCVAPGALNTRLLDQVLAAGPERVGEVFYQRSVRQQQDGGTPLTRGADLIAFLASDESDGITGRLLAALWDDWAELPRQRERLRGSDVFTLRRIVPEDRTGWSGK